MILEGTYELAGAPEAIWPLLLDPEVMAKAMPGTKDLVRTAPDRFRGTMQVAVGPITAAEFDLEVRVVEQAPPDRLVIDLDAKGRLGFARGAARVELSREGTGTRMAYRADLHVGGKIASVGQRLLDVVGRSLLRSGLQALGRELEQRLGSAGASGSGAGAA